MQKQKNLSSLQNLIKRDPVSYIQEFETAYDFFKSLYESYKLSLSKYDRELAEQISFISQVSHCYPQLCTEFPSLLVSVLKQSAGQMEPEMRLTFCKALILMRNKGLVDPVDNAALFSRLFKCPDKLLRKTLANYIVQDVKNINAKNKNAKLNSSLQNQLFSVIQEDNVASKKCLEIMVELYRRQIWRDAKTVNFIGSGCFSKLARILVTALHFFCGGADTQKKDGNNDGDSSDDSDLDEAAYKKQSINTKLAHRVGRKTNKRKKRMERQLLALKKHKKKKRRVEFYDNSALHLLHDPQTFAERLLKQIESNVQPFNIRLQMLDLCSRLIGVHKLQVLNFYPLVQRYLSPRQQEVTRLLLFSAQAAHNLVPPESIEPIVRTIADNFVTDRASAEAIAVGLNSIREICSRAPYAIEEDLLSDLVQYRSYRDKNVSSAAKSLVQVYRELNPSLLHKRVRGRPNQAQAELQADQAANSSKSALQFGSLDAKDYLPGAEELAQLSGGEGSDDDVDEEEEELSDDSSDGEWVQVAQSDDEVEDACKKGEDGSGEKAQLDPAEARRIAREVASTRVLSQKDFEKLERVQAMKRVQSASGRKRKSQSKSINIDIDANDNANSSELASLSDITRLVKRPKMTKAERLETVMEGRDLEDKKKYSYHVRRMNPHASSTNAEKRKSKAFNMIKHKARCKKGGRSFRDKQIAFRDALVKRLRRFKH